MKLINNILVVIIFISSFNIFSNITQIKFFDLFSPVYADIQNNEISNTIDLKHKSSGVLSIPISKNTGLKINQKQKKYYFQSFDFKNNILKVIDSRNKISTFDLDQIEILSIRYNSIKNPYDGVLGSAIAGYIGMVPSMMAGCIVGMTFFPGNQDYGLSRTGTLIATGITLAGTIKSAQYGYNIGVDRGSPYVHFYLNGVDPWTIVKSQEAY